MHARNLEKSTSVYAYLYRTVNIAMFDPNNKYSYVQWRHALFNLNHLAVIAAYDSPRNRKHVLRRIQFIFYM